ncbi:uncharacterized protein CTHT_0020590 [Thermochaetoides thermophila DSM 1495]|uniref:Uncharacterized protein n=1 Tax=Chaetomium thermophilum (strain DSM 1495 / CBS 144.50 / IMI 039719) TaxID=759272 RepID=G0S3D2_CHATD|nr:hypothetical protein CTHT_0020590 [Thermochaetoides thermophila DSM 1495]EGS22515.1 hypothetical protein CTHT_0020590 [Thermochaetoides thermophila DSM 1495]
MNHWLPQSGRVTKVYPAKSSVCIEVSKSSLRETLARKAKEAWYTIEPETITDAYLVKNVPEYILAYDGSRRPTDPAIADEVISVTKQKEVSAHAVKDSPGIYLVILRHKVSPSSPPPFPGYSTQTSNPAQEEGAHLHDQRKAVRKAGNAAYRAAKKVASDRQNDSSHSPPNPSPNSSPTPEPTRPEAEDTVISDALPVHPAAPQASAPQVDTALPDSRPTAPT